MNNFRDGEWFIGLLNEQLGKYLDLTFHNLCPEKISPIFGKFCSFAVKLKKLTIIHDSSEQ